jgi:hypothetical protein
MLCALVRNGVVEKDPEDMTDEQINEVSSYYENIVDVTNDNPLPKAGWIFNGSKCVPPVGVVVVPETKITKFAFISRFTDTELATIEGFAAQSNAYAFAVRVALRKQSLATYIDLYLPETINGTKALVALGLLTLARANEILTNPITSKELYRG